jgi:hypothetical protein
MRAGLLFAGGVVVALAVVGVGVAVAEDAAHPAPDAVFLAQAPHELVPEHAVALAHQVCGDLALAQTGDTAAWSYDEFASALDPEPWHRFLVAATTAYCPDLRTEAGL